MMKCRFTFIEQGEPVPLEELGQNGVDPGVDDDYRHYIDTCFSDLLQVKGINCNKCFLIFTFFLHVI